MEDWKWALRDFFEQWVFCIIFQIIYSLPLWNDLFVFGDCISWEIQQSWGLKEEEMKTCVCAGGLSGSITVWNMRGVFDWNFLNMYLECCK